MDLKQEPSSEPLYIAVSLCPNMAHVRQSGPVSGLGFLVEVLLYYFSARNGLRECIGRVAWRARRRNYEHFSSSHHPENHNLSHAGGEDQGS